MKTRIQRTRENAKNSLAEATVGLVESLNFGTIYTMLSNPISQQFFVEVGRSFMLPIAAAAGIFQAIFAWRQAYLERGKTRSIAHALVETVAALAITTAIVGTLVASTIFASITPIIFAATTAGKLLYNIAATFYYGIQSKTYQDKNTAITEEKRKENTEKKRQESFDLAKTHGIGIAASIVALVATVSVFLLGKAVMAGVGVGLAIIGAGLAIYKGYTAFKTLQSEPAVNQQNQPTMNINGQARLLTAQLGITSKKTLQTVAQEKPIVRQNSRTKPITIARNNDNDNIIYNNAISRRFRNTW